MVRILSGSMLAMHVMQGGILRLFMLPSLGRRTKHYTASPSACLSFRVRPVPPIFSKQENSRNF